MNLVWNGPFKLTYTTRGAENRNHDITSDRNRVNIFKLNKPQVSSSNITFFLKKKKKKKTNLPSLPETPRYAKVWVESLHAVLSLHTQRSKPMTNWSPRLYCWVRAHPQTQYYKKISCILLVLNILLFSP